MRRAALVLLCLLLAVTAPLAVSGFWADRALADSDGYASRMQEAWLHDGIQSELGDLVAAAAQQRILEAFGATAPGQNTLADLALRFTTNRIDTALASGEFVKSWGDWHRQLHMDLAAIVTGGTPESTTVEGSVLRIDISPLVSAVLAGPLGSLALQAIGDDVLVQQIDTGYDIEGQLESFAGLWSSRWWALLAATAALTAASLLARPRPRGTGIGLLAASAGCLAAAVWRMLPAPAPQGEAPALSAAITEALLSGWSAWLLAAAGVLALAGTALVVLVRPATAALPPQGDLV